MTDRRPPFRTTCGPLAAMVTAVVLLTGCGRSTPGRSALTPPVTTASTAKATPHGGLPDPTDIDQRDATAVSRTAITVMWTVDARIDRGQGDAYRRALPYLTAGYAAQVRADPAGTLPATWREHQAYARVSLASQVPESGALADSASNASRQWRITVTPVGRDGWRGAAVHATAFVGLTRTDAGQPWRISTVTTA